MLAPAHKKHVCHIGKLTFLKLNSDKVGSLEVVLAPLLVIGKYEKYRIRMLMPYHLDGIFVVFFRAQVMDLNVLLVNVVSPSYVDTD